MSTASSPSSSPISASLSPNSLFFEPIHKKTGKPPLSKTIEDAIVGIEIENEEKAGFGIAQHPAWQNHPENSLRFNGFEYVLSPPLPLNKAIIATKELFELNNQHYKKIKSDLQIPWTNSIRTSVHVHFDIGLMTWLQLYNFASLYWIMEPLLTNFCGEFRRGNLFCIRGRDSNFIRNEIREELQGTFPMSNPLFNEEYRYASVNFNSVKKFGTLEFRIMRGVSAADDLITWVQILNKIRLFAIYFKTPTELKQWFMDDVNADDLPKVVLGNVLWPTLKPYLESVNIKNEIQTGYFDVHQILSCRPNWKVIETPKELLMPKAKWNPYDLSFQYTSGLIGLIQNMNLPGVLPSHLTQTISPMPHYSVMDIPQATQDLEPEAEPLSTFNATDIHGEGVNL